MSLDALRWGRKIATGKASRKQVLMVLCDLHHSRNGTCFASIPQLVEHTELNWKTINTALVDLEKQGLIQVERRPGKANSYHLDLTVTPSKIGRGPDARSGNLSRGTPSKTGGGPPPKLEGVAESDPLQNWRDTPSKIGCTPPPNLEDEQVETGITGKTTPYSPPPEKLVADRVIALLNQLAGKKYRLTDTNRKGIIARLKEGFTEQDCVQVVSNRVQRWQGTELAQYLRPDTLFRPSKFESYLNDAGETGTTQGAQYSAAATNQLLRSMFPSEYPDEPERPTLTTVPAGRLPWTP